MANGYPPLCTCHSDDPGGRALHHLDNIGVDPDVDDRTRCICIANHRLVIPYGKDRCRNLTRDDSGKCQHCRTFPAG